MAVILLTRFTCMLPPQSPHISDQHLLLECPLNAVVKCCVGQYLACVPVPAQQTCCCCVDAYMSTARAEDTQRDRLVDHVPCTVLQATIDQVDGLMFFDGRSEQLLQWDSQIQGVCNQLNTIVDNIISRDVAMQAQGSGNGIVKVTAG